MCCYSCHGLAFSLTCDAGYQPPTRMLHFFNAPRNCTLDQLKDVSSSSAVVLYYCLSFLVFVCLFVSFCSFFGFLCAFFVHFIVYLQAILFCSGFFDVWCGHPHSWNFLFKRWLNDSISLHRHFNLNTLIFNLNTLIIKFNHKTSTIRSQLSVVSF